MTAKEFIKQKNLDRSFYSEMRRTSYSESAVENLMIQFAQHHVKKALEAAAENATGFHCTDYIDKESIINAYPLTNIQ